MDLAAGLEAKRHLLPDMTEDRLGYADAARVGNLLQPRRDVDGVAVAIVALDDDVADVQPHADVDAPVCGQAVVALGHLALQRNGAFDGIDDAGELGQQAVAGQLEDASMVGGDLGLEQTLAVSEQALEGIRLIVLHEAGVADDVGCENCGQPAFHPPVLRAGQGSWLTHPS